MTFIPLVIRATNERVKSMSVGQRLSDVLGRDELSRNNRSTLIGTKLESPRRRNDVIVTTEEEQMDFTDVSTTKQQVLQHMHRVEKAKKRKRKIAEPNTRKLRQDVVNVTKRLEGVTMMVDANVKRLPPGKNVKEDAQQSSSIHDEFESVFRPEKAIAKKQSQ